MYTKFAKFARLYIFYSLQHFKTKLHNFSKRGVLFQGMVIFLPISIFFKILSERGKAHCKALSSPHPENVDLNEVHNNTFFMKLKR